MYGDLCVLLSWLRELFPILNYSNIYISNNNFDRYNKAHKATLVDLQLDAQNSYLFTYNTFIKILYMFQALLCSSSGLRRNCIL
jgi:hypothetical protein